MGAGALVIAQQPGFAAEARLRGQRFERAVSAMQRVLDAWLAQADTRTLLLPDRLQGPGSGLQAGDESRVYTPHNSGADLYPYLVLTSELTSPDLFRGRMMEMLRNEVRYTNTAWGIPGDLNLNTGELGAPSMGGGLLTASGLYFTGASTERAFWAFDSETGQEIWKVRIPYNANAVPMSYRLRPDSRQFVVIAAGGNPITKIGDALIAFALPQNSKP